MGCKRGRIIEKQGGINYLVLKENEELSTELRRLIGGKLPEGIEEAIYRTVDSAQQELPNIATRVASQKVPMS